ncbi:unnamed protein product, partial [Coregonus sp. 'balchen']
MPVLDGLDESPVLLACEVKLTCKRKSCGSPGEGKNGHFDLSEGILFGDKVVATCNTGYMLVGSDVRTCMDGGWDGRVPLCEVVKCGKPPTIVNGGPVVQPEEMYNYGDVVQYGCEKDYTLWSHVFLLLLRMAFRIEGRPPYTYKSF